MKLIEKEEELLAYVKLMHGEQKRKYTGEPYWHHCYAVAELAYKYNVIQGIEIGLCHDLLEDTKCTPVGLSKFLIGIGYSVVATRLIVNSVIDLTDRYTKEKYPVLNRGERKDLESSRLGRIRGESQSVKYCDLIDNTKSICEHDKSFAKVYLQEKKMILSKMKGGNSDLLLICENQVNSLINDNL